MAAFYTILQFVPDPVADERINAGVIVFDEETVRTRFIENWGRLQRFGNKDVGFLKQFSRDLQERCEDRSLNPEQVREMAIRLQGPIQLTAPRGSLLDLESLLHDAESRFLANDRRAVTRPFTRHSMKKLAIEAAKLAFVQRGGRGAVHYVRPNFSILGTVVAYQFSLAIANGRPLVAAEVFSFLGSDQKAQEKDVRATAWMFEDVKRQNSDLSLAALVIRGDESTEAVEEAEKIFESLGVDIVTKDRISAWADAVAERILLSQRP